MGSWRSTALAIAAATAVSVGALAVPGTAAGQDDLGPGTKDGKSVPRIISTTPMKPMSFAAAKRLRARAKRAGKRPRGPILATTRGLTKVPPLTPDTRARNPSAEAEDVPIDGRKPSGDGKLFGYEGTYDGKKWPILNWVNYVFSQSVPALGGTFRQPAVGEVPPGGVTLAGCGPITMNAMYCPRLNAVGWSSDFGQLLFNRHGDTAFATYMAHEYGHGAQAWMNLYGGWMNYTLYAEGFADCMAGGWLYQMYARGYTDTVGRGDLVEIVDALVLGSDPASELGNHGDARWRVGMATYGWTYGMQGCRDWGRYVARQ
jgi:hypothetical protein